MTIYLAKITVETEADAPGTVIKRLVDAKREATALQHVVADTITISKATPQEIHECAKAGIEIEEVRS